MPFNWHMSSVFCPGSIGGSLLAGSGGGPIGYLPEWWLLDDARARFPSPPVGDPARFFLDDELGCDCELPAFLRAPWGVCPERVKFLPGILTVAWLVVVVVWVGKVRYEEGKVKSFAGQHGAFEILFSFPLLWGSGRAAWARGRGTVSDISHPAGTQGIS